MGRGVVMGIMVVGLKFVGTMVFNLIGWIGKGVGGLAGFDTDGIMFCVAFFTGVVVFLMLGAFFKGRAGVFLKSSFTNFS